jgi:hypothetical protein
MHRIAIRTTLTGLLLLSAITADDQHHHGNDLGSVHFPVAGTPVNIALQ